MLSAINVGFFNLLKLYPETWATGIAYTVGDVVRKTGTYAAYSYKCTTAGTSGGTEPVWGTPVIGAVVSDGTTLKWTTYDAKLYQLKAPQGSTTPYITFGLLTESPIGTFADFEAIENLTYWVNVFSNVSTADVAEIADEVMDALDDKTITVTGYTSMKVTREFISSPTWDSETGIFQISLRYRVWLDKT